MHRELPIPPHHDDDAVAGIWPVPYPRRAAEAERWATEHEIPPAAADNFRLRLHLVDLQNTFCVLGFEPFVAGGSGTGAVDDNRRLRRFLYRNLGAITQVVVTLGTHLGFLVHVAGGDIGHVRLIFIGFPHGMTSHRLRRTCPRISRSTAA